MPAVPEWQPFYEMLCFYKVITWLLGNENVFTARKPINRINEIHIFVFFFFF